MPTYHPECIVPECARRALEGGMLCQAHYLTHDDQGRRIRDGRNCGGDGERAEGGYCLACRGTGIERVAEG